MKISAKNKYQRYEFMKTSPALVPHLPETHRLTKDKLWTMVDQYGEVILKPFKGRRGQGVIKVAQSGTKKYEVHYLNQRRYFTDQKSAYRYILQKKKPRRYMVQRRIPLAEINERPIDFRIIVQRKKKSKRWKVTARAVKVAGDGFIVTNIKRSNGKIMHVSEALKISSLKDINQEKLVADIDKLVLRAARKLIKAHPRKRIYGFDIGVDNQGQIMIIEANSQPMMSHFRELGDKKMLRRIKRYKRG